MSLPRRSGLAPQLRITPPVKEALTCNRPVVALESTIICHGMPYPDNVRTALAVESVVRDAGAVPATIAILGGALCVGLDDDDIEELGRKGTAVAKVSTRDLPVIVSEQADGATTVAATMIIAAMAGIRVFATGGIGGVHRDVAETLDISADLTELSRNPVAVVCAGVKSVLDIGRTLEYLETMGVPVLGFGTDDLPAFYARSSGHRVDRRYDQPAAIAKLMHAKWSMGLNGGLVIGNPVPEDFALDAASIEAVISSALEDMRALGVHGKETTPFLLARIAERTGGESLAANVALIKNNARLAAEIAAQFVSLGQGDADGR